MGREILVKREISLIDFSSLLFVKVEEEEGIIEIPPPLLELTTINLTIKGLRIIWGTNWSMQGGRELLNYKFLG